MQAVVFKRTGNPKEVLSFQDIPRPRLESDEVLVRIEASPIHPSDIMFISGNYRIEPTFPQTAGLEGVGTIVELGKNVNTALDLKVGNLVVFRHPGTWAEEAAVPQEKVYILPESLTWEEATEVFLNPITAWGLLQSSGVRSGDSILSTAGASSVGRWLASFAKAKGIRLIAIVRSSASAEQVLEAGAETALLETEAKPEQVISLTQGGVAAAFDAVGGRQGQLALESLQNGGRLLVYGRMSGDPYPLHNNLIMYRNLSISGFGILAYLENTSRSDIQWILQEASRHIKTGHSNSEATSRYELKDFLAAVDGSGSHNFFRLNLQQ
jgi:NADPH:quinone reductase-like Zn-dependent oxidoreductase